jgi:putative MATE family efflux protein
MLVSFVIGITMGSTIIISQFFGAKQLENVKKTIGTLYIFLFFSSILISLLGIIFSRIIFNLTDLPPNILDQAVMYLNIFLSGSIFFFGFNGTSAILRGLGDSKTPLVFLIISTMMNVLLDLLFVIVLKWGISGVAFATILAQAGAFFSAVIYLNRSHEVVKFNVRKLKFDKEIFYKSMRIGLPSGLQHTFVAMGMIALFGMVNKFGTDAIAAFSVAGRIDSFAAIPAMTFSAALSSFVGQNMGANKPERVRNGFRATLLMTSMISVLVTISIYFWGDLLMGLFTKDVNVIRMGHEYLVIVSSFYIMFSGMFTISGVMSGSGDTIVPMIITLFSLWIIRIPLSWFLSAKFGIIGIWWAIPIAWTIGLIFSYIYYKTGKWKTKVTVKQEVILQDPLSE